MRSGKLARRLLPALFLCGGSALAGDPAVPIKVTPPPLESLVLPGVPVGIPTIVEVPATPPKPVPTVPSPTQLPTYTAPLAAPPPISVYPPEFPSDGMFVGAKETGPGLTWVRAEYLAWTLTGANVPALVTSAPAGAPIAVPGAPGSIVLFGGEKQLGEHRPGARLTLGSWFDSDREFGWEISGFWLDRQDDGTRAGSADGSRTIASSPFTDTNTGQPTAILISAPGRAFGTTQVEHASKSIWGGELVGRALLTSGCDWRLDGFAGFQFVKFNDQLDIHKTINPLNPLVVPGTSIVCDDGIGTKNSFHGGVLGVDCQSDMCCGWLLSVRPSVAIGSMESSVNRTGITIIRTPGAPTQVYPGGTYVLGSNLGEVKTNDCTFLPQLDLRAVKEICPGVRMSIGYTVLYLPQVARAAEQIDPFVNSNLLPPAIPGGAARPSALLNQNAAWLQGLSVGIELRF